MTGADIESVDFQQADLSNAILTEAEVCHYCYCQWAWVSDCGLQSNSTLICACRPLVRNFVIWPQLLAAIGPMLTCER